MNDSAAPRDEWTASEELAERMIPLVGALKREHDVVTSLHGHRLLGLSATGLVEVHDRVAQLGHERLSIDDTLAVLEAIHALGPGASSLDVARLAEGHASSGRPLD
ncbi:MAG: glyceraldehyde-3-phosphate dehydrogenase, partial [Microbacterium sp.]|nr:glyceraldehyde-3-phosphate dehydrogenase [Microbacterium sp.]